MGTPYHGVLIRGPLRPKDEAEVWQYRFGSNVKLNEKIQFTAWQNPNVIK